MLSIVLAVCAQGWRYDGFAHEATARVAAVENPQDAPSPRGGSDPASGPEALRPSPAAGPRTAPPIPGVPAPGPSQAPGPPDVPATRAAPRKSSVSRLADEGGRIWEHPDPDWLRRWVAAKDQELRLRPRQAGPSVGTTRRLSPLRFGARPTPR